MEKRSGVMGIARGAAVGLSAPLGVGGRQGQNHPTSQGGGYLDVCTPSQLQVGASQKKFARDPRLDHLRQMGMHPTWQRVAAEIGVDAFLSMWRILDAEEQFHHHKGNLEINLRRYSSYQRFQRNLYIKSLASAGLNEKQIHYRLITAMGEKLEPSHIRNIVKDK